MAAKTGKPREIKFGAFGGVFTPSVLTIIGVILFLRTGWVVGSTGLVGALAIIILAHTVTIATGLSISSICTNIRIGSGGAYAIIARSLGLEVGGAIGIPLYVSQAISTAFYIAGFTEAWVALSKTLNFPQHDPLIVAVSLWALLSVVSYIGADMALRVQYLIMGAIALSIASFFLGKPLPGAGVQVWTVPGYKDFFYVFSIFFPAVTGILAGVSMSGDLKDPKRSIPLGTMSAILVGFAIYVAAAWWFSRMAGTKVLVANPAVMIDISMFGWAFYVGIFAATLSSALASLVAAPRTLSAMGEHGILPFGRFFAFKDKKGHPRNAVVFTAAFSLVFVVFGSLDTIAPLLTMFFLITYGMVNLVTFIERSTGIVSFRPSFRVPRFVSLFGAVSCFFIMVVIDPIIGTLALVITSGIYAMLVRAGLKTRWGDVRSGLFVSIATWAARQAAHLPKFTKSWTPNLLMPVENPRSNALLFQFARDISSPGGSVIAFSVSPPEDREKKEKELEGALDPIRRDRMFYISAAVEGEDFPHTSRTLTQFLKNIFLKPNILLITVGDDPGKDTQVKSIIDSAVDQRMGIAILKIHPRAGLNQRNSINLILRDKSPNKDLAILLSLQLCRNWERSKLHLVTMVKDDNEQEIQQKFFDRLKEEARLPTATEVAVVKGEFPEDFEGFPRCDVAVCGLSDEIDLDFVRRVSTHSHVTCLFVRDSGEESAFV